MRTSSVLAASILLASTAASAQNGGFDPESLEAGEPVVAYNLAVVPLFTKKAPPYEDYAVLEEAQAAKSVRIAEMPGGQVDQLSVRNAGGRPLFLLGGEVVLGGKQDRMVVSDSMVEPRASRALEVRCVEQGRWDGADLTFHPSDALAHPDLRKAALFQGQGDVWQEVARKSRASNVASATGTYRRVLQDAEVRKRIKGYLDELQGKLPKSERLAGLGVAINGELELVDVFDSPLLYAKLERKLLTSYVLAALERQPGSAEKARRYEAKARKLGKGQVDVLLKEGNAAEGAKASSAAGPTSTGASGKVFRKEGKAVHGTFFNAKSQGSERE